MDLATETNLTALSRHDKLQMLQWLIKDLGDDFAGIESRPNVCGVAVCIVRTRIPVWTLENARRLGISEADLRRGYPALTAQDLANAWAYVRTHRAEIEREIKANNLI